MPLYVVSTPIGNLGDITGRAVQVLQSADCIAAEDTRHSRLLFGRFGVKGRVVSYHDHNKAARTPELLARLKSGQTVALVSDAGTPGIADPGFYLIRAAIAQNISVSPVPGANALLAALVCSGLPTDRFVFENFLPIKKGRREKKLGSLKAETRTVIFYESPHRIRETLAAIQAVFGDIHVVVAREITKKFETFYRGKTSAVLEQLGEKAVKGEIVVLFNPVYQPEGQAP
jgi:16S rRNA (cytidine1402-2'-O)-methyltransferase